MIERVSLLRWMLGSTVDGRRFLAEITVAGGKTPQMDVLCDESVKKKALKDDL